MSTQTNQPETSPKSGARFILLAVILTVLVAAALVFLRQKPTVTPSESTSGLAVSDPKANTERTPADVAESVVPSTPKPAGRVDTATSEAPPANVPDQANLSALIAALKDASKPLEERKEAIKALAQNGSPEALNALRQALIGGSEEVRAAIAEGLGACASPDCSGILLGLLNDPSQVVAKAAINGLAQQGTPAAATALSQLLYDPLRSVDLRTDAALGLGKIEQPGVLQTLSQAAVTINDEDIVAQVLNAIGSRNFSETESFFQGYLRSPNLSSDLRVAAVESLGQAQGDPTAFLATLAADPDPEVRMAAGWAMSSTEATGTAGPQLVGLLQGEQDADVRRRLYQALRNQESFDVPSVLAAVQKENDVAARLAGLDLLADNLRQNPTPELQSYFDQTATAELKNAALTSEGAHERMVAIMALSRAGTPQAMAALQEVAQQSKDPRITQSVRAFVAAMQPPPAK